ncbi:MAG TPA: DUF3224 domain-containing protein [Acidimicrobiales bacterium]|jgi:hypothetical protein
MPAHLSATFDVTSWDETPFEERASLPRLTRAVVTKAYSGDIEGSSITQWLMAYRGDTSATFVGLERITGHIGSKEGTLVVQHVGTYADGEAKASLSVVEGANSDGLQSATGSGDFLANPSGSVTLNLSYE